MQNKRLILPIVATLMLAGCVNLAPNYERPTSSTSQTWQEGEAYQNLALAKAPLASWEAFVGDEKLKQVIKLTLKHNHDLKIALLNVEKAQAQYGITRSALFPSVNAVAQNVGSGTPGTLTPNHIRSTSHSYSAQLAMTSYELDLFGRVRNMKEKALQAFFMTEQAKRSAQNTLLSQTVMMWYQLATDLKQLDLQKEVLATQEKSFELLEKSYQLGATSELDYQQAQSTVMAARASIQTYVRAVAQDKNALTLLVGQPLDEQWMPDSTSLVSAFNMTFPEGLPSEVLLNRPDVKIAEQQILAANADVGMARAAFFPRVSLTLGGGSGATHLSDLFDPHTGMWSFIPNVSLPIFAGGANVSQLKVAKTEQKIAYVSYDKTLQVAFKEVLDAMATEGTIEQELKAREAYAKSSQRAFDLSRARYDLGASSYLQLLDAQRQMVSAEQVLLNTQLARIASSVTLYKVLGGEIE